MDVIEILSSNFAKLRFQQVRLIMLTTLLNYLDTGPQLTNRNDAEVDLLFFSFCPW